MSDPVGICNETISGSHVVPGVESYLICDVNNTGSYNKRLIWITPIGSTNILFLTKSSSLSHAMYNGDISNTTLTFKMITKNFDIIHYTVITNKDHLNISSNATFSGNLTNFTLTVEVETENADSLNHSISLNHNNSSSSYHQMFAINVTKGSIMVEGETENTDLILSSGTLRANNTVFFAIATFDGDLANSTLTFNTSQSLDDQVVTCKDTSGNSMACTLQIYSTFTLYTVN